MATKLAEKAEAPQIKHSKTDNVFTLVKDKNGIKIVIGNYQVSKKSFKTWNDAEMYIEKKPYELLINVSSLFASLTIKNLKQNENNEENPKNA